MSKKAEDPQLAEISQKLDQLIRLTAIQVVKDIKTQKDQVILLSDMDFPPKQIAAILGTTSNTVRVALSNIKRKNETDLKEEHAESNPQSNVN